MTEAAREIEELSGLLRKYEYEYHVLNDPSVSDAEYDRLFDRLSELETEFPDLVKPDSPTMRVGSDLTSELPEVEHTVPVRSLDKAYSHDEVLKWIWKTIDGVGRSLSFVVEEKIDGVSIVLYYENGVLARAVTRGNGVIGNDITGNVRTVRSVPLRLAESVDIAVRGEIYLPKHRFSSLNAEMEVPYANPRNLAAGTLRRIKSSDVASIPLEMFTYEAHLEGVETHIQAMKRLAELGFRLNPNIGFFSDTKPEPTATEGFEVAVAGTFDELGDFILEETEKRESLPYEIDGLVVKVNEMSVRDELGFTGHHPRWSIAYKFESPQGMTRVDSIDVQVGRTGRITPVARVEPVSIGGSTIQNVTLHNQDYVEMLELAIGDTVLVSRRGDVIPAVEKVVEKNENGNSAGRMPNKTWRMPKTCPSCNHELEKRGAHHFCPNRDCPAQVLGRLYFFVGKGQMDIDYLGPETLDTLIEENLVADIPDIYTCNYDQLLEIQGFGPKKVTLIKNGVEQSKKQPYRTVLQSLGILELGPNVAELLSGAGFRSIDDLYAVADSGDPEPLVAIDGIGEKTAETIIRELSDPAVRRRIDALRKAGLSFSESDSEAAKPENVDNSMEGQVWCVTGSFENFKPRDEAMEEVRRRGGRTVSQVTGSTTHLLAGSGGGSKLAKARNLGVTVVSEDEFLEMLHARQTNGS